MLIGLTGRKGSGKDTVADIILKYRNGEKRTFAYPLKKACQIIFGLSEDQLEKDKEVLDKRWNMTPRQMFQIVGTDLFRKHFSGSIWVDTARIWLQENLKDDTLIIFSDVRFQNEANLIREFGGKIIRVQRDSVDKTDKHVSETEMDGISVDFTIQNNGSQSDLHLNIAQMTDIQIYTCEDDQEGNHAVTWAETPSNRPMYLWGDELLDVQYDIDSRLDDFFEDIKHFHLYDKNVVKKELEKIGTRGELVLIDEGQVLSIFIIHKD